MTSKCVEFTASMMCANYANLEKEVRDLEAGGINGFHIDIMDGEFVPNFGMGIHDMKYIRSATKLPIDVHLMIKEPRRYMDIFIESGADIIYVHPESEFHPSTTLEYIIQAGVIPGIAINPGTSIESVMELLYIVDRVLVMSVNPGHAGQVYLPYAGKKVEKLLSIRQEYGVEVYWDGACSEDKVRTFAPLGVKGFVLGTASLFEKERKYCDILRELRVCGTCCDTAVRL